MTVISKISVFSHKNNIGGKVWNPAIRWSDKYAVFISIESDQGDEGIGECWCFDAAPDSLVAYLRTEVVPQLIGINLDEFESRTEQLRKRSTLTARHGILMSALSGMDIAVWDLRAQQANCPLWAHLNPNGRGYTPLYAFTQQGRKSLRSPRRCELWPIQDSS